MPAMLMYSSEQSFPSLLALRKLLLSPLFEKTAQYPDLLKCDDAIPCSENKCYFQFFHWEKNPAVFNKTSSGT